ncbi:uncharacterized protein LOC122005063 [Zingiber officinale]|uniref:Uncharacterized protein n=1 Tax=Zingiber officinale TaxID=94328 RepID=A0A8J5FFE4_ZINOF|nr:uncharacterized protein LOC122005063 [Zingiber officinale]XP_042415903.1 uncharacterized protein LOC122005063 [Zingiber officinale]XP_042415904.1 uncharacterized protein LOC122005063 [Zingiber officinale]KAG6488607.1 hypothetical protein ZIOFF_049854 [Zingiber officinale]
MAESRKPSISAAAPSPKPRPQPTPIPGAEDPAGWKGARYPNPPDSVNPDVTTLRDQWRFAIRQYSRWYSQAWGTAILAGVSFFALGWLIKGSNPLPSRSTDHTGEKPSQAATSTEK